MVETIYIAMRSTAPQEPDEWDAFDKVLCLINSIDVPPSQSADQMRRRIYGLVHNLRPGAGLKTQEPVADDDAEWLRRIANDWWVGAPFKARLERIATRLQAKAPMRIIPADPIVFEE